MSNSSTQETTQGPVESRYETLLDRYAKGQISLLTFYNAETEAKSEMREALKGRRGGWQLAARYGVGPGLSTPKGPRR